MKEKELREHATCSVCDKPIGHTGLPLFWSLKIERFGLDLVALQRQQGLALQIGAALAMVMGPDEDMAKPVMDPVTVTLCESCAIERRLPLASLACVAEESEAEKAGG